MADITTTISGYTEEDIPEIVRICTECIRELPHYKGIEVEPSHLEFLLKNNMNNDAGMMVRVLRDPSGRLVGGCAAYCVKLLFSKALTTNDIFIYVVPEWRSLPNFLKLFHTYKEWAIARGAKLICTTYTSGFRAEEMDAMIRRIGFTRVGNIYHLRRD